MFQTTCYHSTQKRNSFWNTLHSTEPAPPELSTRESKALQRVHQWLEGHLQQRRSNCPREEAARFSRQPHACPWPGCPHTDMTHTHTPGHTCSDIPTDTHTAMLMFTVVLRHTQTCSQGHTHVHSTRSDIPTHSQTCSHTHIQARSHADTLMHTQMLTQRLAPHLRSKIQGS